MISATLSAAAVPPDSSARSLGRRMLNKVPEITVFFWVIKVLCTTVGETFADNLNENLGLGLSGTSYIMGALLIVVLAFQPRRVVPNQPGNLLPDLLVFSGAQLLRASTTSCSST